jgi:O-palmitoleoyl-L-serine hydrolase
VGSATTPSAPLLYFHGLYIRRAAVASLQASYNFKAATDIVVGGGSAGGLAAYLHVDWYASQAPPGAKARGLPDSGFFEDGNYTRDGKSDYEGRMANLYEFTNAVAGISPACTATLGYKCLFAYHLLPYIKSPVLALNSVSRRGGAGVACGMWVVCVCGGGGGRT